MVANVIDVKLYPPLQSDHSIVVLTIRTHEEHRGRGYWKFNNSLLKDTDYINITQNLLSDFLSLHGLDPSSQRKELSTIRKVTVKYFIRKAQNSRRYENEVLGNISTLERLSYEDNSDEIRRKLSEAREKLMALNYRVLL